MKTVSFVLKGRTLCDWLEHMIGDYHASWDRQFT